MEDELQPVPRMLFVNSAFYQEQLKNVANSDEASQDIGKVENSVFHLQPKSDESLSGGHSSDYTRVPPRSLYGPWTGNLEETLSKMKQNAGVKIENPEDDNARNDNCRSRKEEDDYHGYQGFNPDLDVNHDENSEIRLQGPSNTIPQTQEMHRSISGVIHTTGMSNGTVGDQSDNHTATSVYSRSTETCTPNQKEKRPYKCNLCDKTFTRNDRLTRHVKSHTGEKPFICSVCNKTFSENTNMKAHMRIHTGEKPHECSICFKAFTESCHLKMHMKIHTGEKPHKCSICNKAFIESGSLKAHMNTHTGVRPYECPVCSKTFTQRAALNKHVRIHTGERPHKCPVCDKAFNGASNLSNHVRTHTGEKPHTCVVCGRAFYEYGHLKRHMKTHEQPNE